MFEALSDKLRKVLKDLRGQGRLTEAHIEAALREIRIALLEADVEPILGKLGAQSRTEAVVKWLKPGG